MARRPLWSAVCVIALLTAAPVAGQDELPIDTEQVPDSLVVDRVSPGGAFLRSVLVPGWGQAAVGSYNRAGFYFTVETASLWMFLKSRRTLSMAEKELALLEADETARLMAEGIEDPGAIESALEDDEAIADQRALVASRGQQREDWVAFGLFMVLLGGADAFVASHLQGFPDALETNLSVLPDGRFEAGVSVRLPYH